MLRCDGGGHMRLFAANVSVHFVRVSQFALWRALAPYHTQPVLDWVYFH